MFLVLFLVHHFVNINAFDVDSLLHNGGQEFHELAFSLLHLDNGALLVFILLLDDLAPLLQRLEHFFVVVLLGTQVDYRVTVIHLVEVAQGLDQLLILLSQVVFLLLQFGVGHFQATDQTGLGGESLSRGR